MEYNIENEKEFFDKFICKYISMVGEADLTDHLECNYGTGYWQRAFDFACDESNNSKLKQYCKDIDWMDYDELSHDISELALKHLKNFKI